MPRKRTSALGDAPAKSSRCLPISGSFSVDLGVDFEAVVQFTTYPTRADSIPAFMTARGEIFPKLFAGGKYPPNTLLVVDRLVKAEFLLEVEAIARLPS